MATVFTKEWADELRRQLTTSEEYRQAATRWTGDLVLRWIAPEAGDPAVFLALSHGDCHAARPATEADIDQARFVLGARRENWEQVLAGELPPLQAVMRGRLKLEKGSTFELLPHVKAAEALLSCAQKIATEFPIPASAAAVAVDGTNSSSRAFRVTAPGGLNFDSPVMRLWEKAKRDGIWNPAEIDLEQDRLDWNQLAPDEQDLLLRLAALFGAGEESVVVDLLPLMQVIASEGRLEEEIYLTSFLWEEAKHVEAFRRFFDCVAQDSSDLTRYHGEHYKTIFYRELPAAMNRLRTDASPAAQAEASTTYNLIVEGVLAETGYYVYGQVLRERGILPGMQEVIRKLSMDESRHLAYGVYLLSRLVAEHGDVVWNAIERRMNSLLEAATGVVEEAFDAYDPQNVPFGLGLEPFMDYALSQFQKRLKRVELARHQTLDEIVGSRRALEELPMNESAATES